MVVSDAQDILLALVLRKSSWRNSEDNTGYRRLNPDWLYSKYAPASSIINTAHGFFVLIRPSTKIETGPYALGREICFRSPLISIWSYPRHTSL